MQHSDSEDRDGDRDRDRDGDRDRDRDGDRDRDRDGGRDRDRDGDGDRDRGIYIKVVTKLLLCTSLSTIGKFIN